MAFSGRILTHTHLARERNRKLVENKRKQVLKKRGKLACEACDFDFSLHYGSRGLGFIECHHTKPVASLCDGHKTHLNDLALVCANWHRDDSQVEAMAFYRRSEDVGE
jgi:5-methylcytosine-specific restriction protein A